MLKLSRDNFIKARDYIFENAEDIDRAWFRYIFEDKNANAFLGVLAKYQHDNGGFGGLYYEFDYQGPCLKSTEIAVKYILSLEKKPSADHPIIQKTMKYLLDNYLPGIGNWGEVVVPAVNDGWTYVNTLDRKSSFTQKQADDIISEKEGSYEWTIRKRHIYLSRRLYQGQF